MTAALLVEDNLVVHNKQDAFRRQIGMAFSLETLNPQKKEEEESKIPQKKVEES